MFTFLIPLLTTLGLIFLFHWTFFVFLVFFHLFSLFDLLSLFWFFFVIWWIIFLAFLLFISKPPFLARFCLSSIFSSSFLDQAYCYFWPSFLGQQLWYFSNLWQHLNWQVEIVAPSQQHFHQRPLWEKIYISIPQNRYKSNHHLQPWWRGLRPADSNRLHHVCNSPWGMTRRKQCLIKNPYFHIHKVENRLKTCCWCLLRSSLLPALRISLDDISFCNYCVFFKILLK